MPLYPGSKLIFRILVSGRAGREYHWHWERRRDRAYAEIGREPPALTEKPSSWDLYVWANDPPQYPYNDLRGFVDLYWDGGTGLLVDVYLHGDGRTKAGKAVRSFHGGMNLRRDHFYPHGQQKEVGRFSREATPEQLRAVLLKALDRIEKLIGRYGYAPDMALLRELATALDVQKLIQC